MCILNNRTFELLFFSADSEARDKNFVDVKTLNRDEYAFFIQKYQNFIISFRVSLFFFFRLYIFGEFNLRSPISYMVWGNFSDPCLGTPEKGFCSVFEAKLQNDWPSFVQFSELVAALNLIAISIKLSKRYDDSWLLSKCFFSTSTVYTSDRLYNARKWNR